MHRQDTGNKPIELRDLPGIDRLLKDEALAPIINERGVAWVKNALRELQQSMRQARSAPEWAADASGYAARLRDGDSVQGHRPVFNLTGTLIHTNLGRAMLPESVWEAVKPIATRPSNLEFDLDTGRRGHRDNFVADKLAAATGAEAACVVNNNAAALLIVLNTFALGKNVPVSRGELIEIGGSFRLPEIMARSGCKLVEVGTTNRTHAKDFATALTDAGLLLKVHPSNYHVEGFTKTVSVSDMRAIAEEADLPFCIDLGSGTLVDLQQFGLPHEPTPRESLEAGADLVTFSGDKLLGGVQAGLIVGRADLIQAINANPLKRALRVDKITLAALSATIDLYDRPDALRDNLPILQAMTVSNKTLNTRARAVAITLTEKLGTGVEIRESSAQIGSGSLPDKRIESVSVVVTGLRGGALDQLHHQLRHLSTPIIGRIHQNALWLDMRGANPLDELLNSLGGLSKP